MLLLTNGLNSMSKQDLRPNELKFIEENAQTKNDFICVIRDGFSSIIAFKRDKRGKKKELFIKEIKRVITVTNECYVTDYYGRSYMGGYRVMFDDYDLKHKGGRYWYNDMSTQELYMKRRVRNDILWKTDWEARYYLTPGAYRLFSIEDLERLGRRTYKYFGLSKDTERWRLYDHIKLERHNPWGFIETFMENLPASEMLCKFGLAEFVGSKRICSLDKKAFKRFAKWGNANKNADGFRCYSINEYISLSKLGVSIDDYEHQLLLDGVSKAITQYRLEAKELINYLKKQPFTKTACGTLKSPHDVRVQILCNVLPHYLDYLKQAKLLDLNIGSRGVLFPADFDQRLLEVSAIVTAKKNVLKARALRNACKKLGIAKTVTYKNGLSFVIPTTQKQFVEIGNKLHMCVGSCGYSDKVVQGTSLIIGVWKDNKPVNCIELGVPTGAEDKYKTLQNRGDHNRDSECQDLVSKDLAKYIAMANQSWRNIHATA